ncbi:GTP cyclohydrolase II [Actinophytocola xanthii]|uniref:GTP cyclohydrolase-2 n=1 Tax=Actinophytocola xanthii TaxID=1912961 RepID=A0A1Q8CS17_9PSEU|nr:GTP cyclohydrolase II [Actinophytocola xanthii]OLF17158.1 GTP cyclohydrolase II [Actinophytocola xanthii]
MTELADIERQGTERVGETRLPTRYGEFRAIGYVDAQGDEHMALVHGDLTAVDSPLTRVHSECLTGDVFASTRCECGEQLATALHCIVTEGAGMVIYLTGHEGRGIGLVAKLQAMRLQEDGLDTVEANVALGLPIDARNFDIAADILDDLGVGSIRLLSNNPQKVESLRANGIRITERVPLLIEPSPDNLGYLSTKRERLGHHLPHLSNAASTPPNEVTRLASAPRPFSAEANEGRPTTPDSV